MRYADAVDEFGVSETTGRAYESLAVMAEVVADDAVNGHVLLWWLDALCSPMEQLESYVMNGGWGPNVLDADTAVDAALPYQGQFVGVVVDPISPVSARDQVRAHSGFHRGSVNGVKTAIRAYLGGDKHVAVLERSTVEDGFIVGGFPWRYTVVVRSEEVQNMRYIDEAAVYVTYQDLIDEFPNYEDITVGVMLAERAVQTTKPGGDLATLISLVGIVYYDLHPGFYGTDPFPTYADLMAAFPTYADIPEYELLPA